MTQQMANKEDRRYFRIQDLIGVSYRSLTEAEYHSLKVASQYAEVPALDELSEIDQQLEILFEKVKIRSAEAAEMGRLLNQKLNVLIDNSGVAEGISSKDDMPQQLVDMSACGMALGTTESLEAGQYLQIRLVLQSGSQFLKLLAKVVDSVEGYGGDNGEAPEECENAAQFTHTARIEFVDVSERIQEFLIQYVVKRQSAQLKATRNPQPTPLDKINW